MTAMKTMLKLAPVIGLTALLAACGTTKEHPAAKGALGAAVAGQAIGGNTGATVAGGVIGAVAGAATTPKKPHE
jgi:osmotically inducible lipoprotein OsmB